MIIKILNENHNSKYYTALKEEEEEIKEHFEWMVHTNSIN